VGARNDMQVNNMIGLGMEGRGGGRGEERGEPDKLGLVLSTASHLDDSL